MPVHIIMDASNVLLSYQSDKRRDLSTLFMQVDKAVLHGRKRGEWCFIVRSEGHELFHHDGWHKTDVVDMESRGYRGINLPRGQKTLHCRRCNHQTSHNIEKNVDLRIVDLLYQATLEVADGDTIALVSGDSDFFNTVKFISQNFQVKMEVWSFAVSAAQIYQGQETMRYCTLDKLLKAV